MQIPVNSITTTTELDCDRIDLPQSLVCFTLYNIFLIASPMQAQGPVYAEVSTLPSQLTTGYLLDHNIVQYTSIDVEATKSRARAMPKPKPVQKNALQKVLTKGECMSIHTTRMFSVFHTGIEADKLVDIDRVLVQLKSVQNMWREIGKALKVPETHIEQVEPYCISSDVQGMTEMIDFWIRSCVGKPTWRELASALKYVGQEQLANLLMEVYETGACELLNHII